MNKGVVVATFFVVLVAVMVMIPALLTGFGDEELTPVAAVESEKVVALPDEGPIIRVYRTKEKRTEEISLEAYVRGVVAAEMPADFHVEALKAQALAARTYIIDRLRKDNFHDMESSFGEGAKGAHVSDTVRHQVYASDEMLRAKWGAEYISYSNKVNQAVKETENKVLLYEKQPIYAAFFSTSNGRTENSEDYFTAPYPYLRSVDSSWDQESPKFRDEVTLSLDEFSKKLLENTRKKVSPPNKWNSNWIKVKGWTEGERVDEVIIDGQLFSGREVREALNLSSSDFTWKYDQGKLTFRTEGYGHGVGMSQWGANLMAEEGKGAQEIVKHYYSGIDIGQVNQVLASKK
ncbi:stage II sporulation protein D [Mechercharimyces sp. CAU 1602]|uniref:stage II sporulation protein D n=1 Tax=Mechercharimyces sp. CAU 1602 TaxID=2973933 RepID=UPI002163A94B|nr:stage II sporulation protein D [Mechercharimyces sp. CAU 1602]MCS1352263.1 stage II sporulation protein D [Mechercharimyces sp. CAU 1602]